MNMLKPTERERNGERKTSNKSNKTFANVSSTLTNEILDTLSHLKAS